MSDDTKPKLIIISGAVLQTALDKVGITSGLAKRGYSFVPSTDAGSNIETGALIKSRTGFDPTDVSYRGIPFYLNIIDPDKMPLLQARFDLKHVATVEEAASALSRGDVVGRRRQPTIATPSVS